MHDLSKFSPVEFFESVRYWTGKRSPILVAKEKTGISYAWLHHKGRNRHHYEYWVDKLDEGGVPHKIPFEYVIEMVCDWLSAAKTYHGDSSDLFKREYDWWCDHAGKLNIHNDTKQLIYKILWNLSETQQYRGNEKRTLEVIEKMVPYWKKTYETGFYDDKYGDFIV